MTTTLVTKKYISKTFGVPFYETSSESAKVKIKVPKFTESTLSTVRGSIREKAANEFITSYLPEFYSFLTDQEYFQDEASGDLDLANQIKQDVIDACKIETFYQPAPPSPNKTIAIVRCLYDFDSTRQELEENGTMPDFEANLAFFNEEQKIEGQTSETTLTVGTLGRENNLLNNGLKMFDTQYSGFEGQININAAFGPLQAQATAVLNILVAILSHQLKIQTPSLDFSEADTITLFFGKRNNVIAISRIDYLLVEESIQGQPLKIGYFSIIKNNNLLKDPLTLAILRNYQGLLASIQDSIDTNNPNSFMDFLRDPSVLDSLGAEGNIFENFALQPKKDMENEFLRVAGEQGLIDMKNVDALEKGFKDYFTSEEYDKLKKEVADNPEVFRRVAAAQTVKALSTAADVANQIANVIESGPLGMLDKAAPKVAYIMRQFGLDEIAKEAFLCLTFGASQAAARVSRATSNALVSTASSIYLPPTPPPRAPISIPELNFEQFKPFTISGDLWKEIEKTLVDTLQQTVLEIIKELAELLRENCPLNSPRSSDYGANDITSFMGNNPNPELANLPTVGAGSQLDMLSKKNNLTSQQIMDYLSALSSILSSMDICTLMINRENVGRDLFDRILEFNQEYNDEDIKNRLDSYSDILGFFADLSAMVDVTDLCNQIANELYVVNQDNICLDEGLFDDNLENLLDLIENGLVLDTPNPNLDCPDSKFLDPTITKSIPETFNTLAETVQLQFISSADSLKEIMLEPVQRNQSRTLDDIKMVTDVDSPSINPDILAKIISVFTDIQEGFEDIDEALDSCGVDIANILGTEPAAAAAVAGSIGQAVTDAVKNPEFKDAIQNVINNVQNLQGPQSASNPVFTTYQFNQNFLNGFRDYIQPEKFVYNPEDLQTVTEKFYSSFVLEGNLEEYRNLELLFRFAEEAPILSLNYGGNDIPLSALQDIAAIELAPDEHIHFYTEYAGDYVIHNHSSDIGDGVHDTQNGTYTDGHVHPFATGLQPATIDIPTVAEGFNQTLAEVEPSDALLAALGVGTGIEDPGRIPDSLSLNYPPFGLTGPQLTIDFNLDRFFQDNAEDEILGGEKAATLDEYGANLELASASVSQTANIFVNKFATAIINNLNSPSLADQAEVYYSDYPQAYGQLVNNAFEYVLDNGVFDAATLQALNFFTQTSSCPPEELGDFLDIQGIIDQMIDEYKEAACSGDDVPLSSKIRNVIKYGMYLLLVQLHIAEVIMKNIFVMSAYNLDSLLDRNSFVFTFIRGQILQSLLTYFDNIEPAAENIIRVDLATYFNLKASRSLVVDRGGIYYVDGTLAIPAGTQFSSTDAATFFGFDEIVDFLITDRIDRSRQVINNALRKALPHTNQLSFNESIIRSLPGLVVENDSRAGVEGALVQMQTFTLTAEILNIPENGLIMTLKNENVYADGETSTEEASEAYEALTTLERLDEGLQPLEFDEDQFSLIDTPYSASEERYLNYTTNSNSISIDVGSNAISVYVSNINSPDDEFEVLARAQDHIDSKPAWGAGDNTELRNVVPKIKAPRPNGGPMQYGYQVNGVYDSTIVAQSEEETEDSGDPIFQRRYFKIWYKKGTNVYLLLDLGYRATGEFEDIGLAQDTQDPNINTGRI